MTILSWGYTMVTKQERCGKSMKKRLSLLLALVFCLGLVPFASADNSPFGGADIYLDLKA